MQSVGFRAEIKINHESKISKNDIVRLLMRFQQQLETVTGVYVSTSVNIRSRAFYNKAYCRLKEGENIYVIRGTINPNYVDVVEWKKTVLLLMNKLRIHLLQSMIAIEFDNTDVCYIDSNHTTLDEVKKLYK